MNPTSVRGIRRQIARFMERGKPVPQWVMDNLGKALREAGDNQTPEKAIEAMGIRIIGSQKKRAPGYRVLPGNTFGKATKGRSLSGEELALRKLQITGHKET